MRGNAEAHELIAPGSLDAVLELLASAPGQWTPIAGGTELMVAYAAVRQSRTQNVEMNIKLMVANRSCQNGRNQMNVG